MSNPLRFILASLGTLTVSLLILIMGPVIGQLGRTAITTDVLQDLVGQGYVAFAQVGGTYQVNGHLLPNANNTYDLGENATPLNWRDGWFSRNVSIANNLTVSTNATVTGNLTVSGAVLTALNMVQAPILLDTAASAGARLQDGGAQIAAFRDSTNARGINLTLTAAGAQTISTTAGDLTLSPAGNLAAKVGRTATLTIAANDATALEKAQADYVADGTADNVEIQAAIDALPAAGGGVALSSGTFSLSAGLFITTPKYVHLSGQGRAVTILSKDFNGGAALTLRGTGATQNHGSYLSDFYVTNGGGATTGTGIYFTPNNSNNDLGYLGYMIDSVTVSVGGTMQALVINDELGKSFSYATIQNSWFHASNNAAYSVRIAGSPGVNGITFINTKITGGNVALSITGFGVSTVETISFIGGQIGNSATWGLNATGIGNAVFSGVHMEGNLKQAIYLQGTRNVSFINIRVDGSGLDAGDYPIVVDSDSQHTSFDGMNYSGAPGTAALFRIEGGATGTIIRNSRTSGSRPFISVAGEFPHYSNNIGYVTTKAGTATLLNGQTSVVFAHGLAAAPTHVGISWKENPTNLIADWWWTADATNITLNGVDPGASNLDFSWEAIAPGG